MSHAMLWGWCIYAMEIQIYAMETEIDAAGLKQLMYLTYIKPTHLLQNVSPKPFQLLRP